MNKIVIEDGFNGFLKEMLQKFDWDADIAWSVMNCESNGNPIAHNFSVETRDDSWGLFQINLYGDLATKRPSPEWLVIPENNINYAFQLYQQGGWEHWKNCL